MREVEGRKVRDGLGTLSMEIGANKILYKYEGPWTEDRMGEGPGELLVYIVKETVKEDDDEEGEDDEDEEPASDPTQILLHYQGTFKNNMFDSYGSLTTETQRYNGHFRENKKSGSGKITVKIDSGKDYDYEGIWDSDQAKSRRLKGLSRTIALHCYGNQSDPSQ